MLFVDGENEHRRPARAVADAVGEHRRVRPGIRGAHPHAAFPAALGGRGAVPGLGDAGRPERHCGGSRRTNATLIILDNFSTLAEVADENEASAMTPVLAFLLRLKQEGRARILVHHSGKSRETFRGSSKLATTFEVIIGLSRSTDTEPAKGRHLAWSGPNTGAPQRHPQGPFRRPFQWLKRAPSGPAGRHC